MAAVGMHFGTLAFAPCKARLPVCTGLVMGHWHPALAWTVQTPTPAAQAMRPLSALPLLSTPGSHLSPKKYPQATYPDNV